MNAVIPRTTHPPPPLPGPVVAVLEDSEAMAHVSLVIAYPTFEQYATTAFTDDGTVGEYERIQYIVYSLIKIKHYE